MQPFHVQVQQEPEFRWASLVPTTDQPVPERKPIEQVVQLDANNMQPFQVQVEQEPEFSWCSLVTAVLSMCCCTVIGIIATIMAVLSYVDHSTKQYEHSKSKRSVAYGLAITAIVIGAIIAVAIVLLIMMGMMEDED